MLKNGPKFSVTQSRAMENGQNCAGDDKTKKVAGQRALVAACDSIPSGLPCR